MWEKIKRGAIATWNFLDGKKTAIGTACLIAADYIPRDKTAYYILSIAGQILGGTGLVHKVNKADKLPDGMRTSVKITRAMLNKVRNIEGE